MPTSDINLCNTFWGTHGCDEQKDHKGPCKCHHDEETSDGTVILGDVSTLYKIHGLADNPFVQYDHEEYDGQHFGIVYWSDDQKGYLTVWF